MFHAIANFFGFGNDDSEELVNTAPIRGEGVHKHAFTGQRREHIRQVYDVQGQIGRGSFGQVYGVLHKATRQHAVCKMILKAVLKDDNIARNEIEILRVVDHPNIIRLYEYFEDDKAFYIISERIWGGDLQTDLMQTSNGLSVKQVALNMRQVLLATNYCHNLEIAVVHRDLKPSNVMKMEKSWNSAVKIIDYGLGNIVDDAGLRKVCGTPVFMAPEVFDGHYGKEADIWAIGIMLYYLLTKRTPFPTNAGMDRLKDEIRNLCLDFPQHHGWETWRLRTARDLIRGLLDQDPSCRLSAAEALRSEFVEHNAPPAKLGWRGPSRKLIQGFNGYAIAPAALRIVLLMSACHMDQDKMKRMKQQFEAIDTDCDGFISERDLEALLGRSTRPADTSEVLLVVDMDKDGAIGFSEFVAAWLYGRLGKNTDCLKHAFDLIDTDRDGLVQRADVRKSLRTPQLKELGGTAFLNELGGIFPDSESIDYDGFVACLLEHEPVRLGLRWVRSRRRTFLEDRCGCYWTPKPTAEYAKRAGVQKVWASRRSTELYDADGSDLEMVDRSDDDDESVEDEEDDENERENAGYLGYFFS